MVLVTVWVSLLFKEKIFQQDLGQSKPRADVITHYHQVACHYPGQFQ